MLMQHIIHACDFVILYGVKLLCDAYDDNHLGWIHIDRQLLSLSTLLASYVAVIIITGSIAIYLSSSIFF